MGKVLIKISSNGFYLITKVPSKNINFLTHTARTVFLQFFCLLQNAPSHPSIPRLMTYFLIMSFLKAHCWLVIRTVFFVSGLQSRWVGWVSYFWHRGTQAVTVWYCYLSVANWQQVITFWWFESVIEWIDLTVTSYVISETWRHTRRVEHQRFCDLELWTRDFQNLTSSWPGCRKYLYSISFGSNLVNGSLVAIKFTEFYGHCWLTLTFDPATLKRSSLSREPGNEWLYCAYMCLYCVSYYLTVVLQQ